MAFNGRYQATLTLTGSGLGAGGVPYMEDTEQTTPPGINLPPPGAVTLAAGINTLLLPPATFSFSRVMLLPPAGSANAKSIGANAAGTGAMSGWTSGSMTVPGVPGGTIYVTSAGIETLIVGYCP